MDKEKNTKTKQKDDNLLWVIAYKLGFKLLFWIAVPILLALYIGKSLDTHYQSGQIFFICFIGVAFIISSIGIVKEAMKSMNFLDELGKTDEIDKCTDKSEKK